MSKIFVAGMIFSVFLMPLKHNLASAGFFSFLDDFWGGGQAEESPIYNSQTISLMKPTSGLGNNIGQGGGDITIVNGSALLPDAGPMGTTADVKDDGKKQPQISIYIVREGDNLSQIAKMFDVSISTIAWANDIKGGLITPGQTLVILPVSGIQYTIKKGDTLNSVAKKFKGSVDDILAYNNLNGNELVVGETIIIPDGVDPSLPNQTQKKSSNPYRGGSGPSYAGYYLRPVNGGVKSQGLHGYNGIDIADSCGVPILASASGDVVIGSNYGWNGGYGKYVVLSHTNGTQTLYGHLSNIIVTEGWHVAQGQVIGYMGSTGKSTGCHVHFEIRGAKNPF